MNFLTKKLRRFLALLFIPFLGSILIRLIYLTNKKVFDISDDTPQDGVIFAFWHSDLLMMPYLYYQFRKTPNASVVISDHFDGKIIAKVMSYFKLGVVHGSSNKNAAKVLLSALKSLKDGKDIGITPDGPRGPRYEVSKGVIALAQKRDAKVVVFSLNPTKFWQLNSWDKFVIPKPFGKLYFRASSPIDLSGISLDEATLKVKSELMRYAN